MQGSQNPILQCLYYYDSDGDSPICTPNALESALGDFKPFREVAAHCFKDRNFAAGGTPNEHASNTSGFLPCLATLQNESIVEEPKSVDYFSQEITDSELLSCWDQVDKMLTTTPEKKLRLVNSILEDFELSPFTVKNEESTQFWQYSPQFVLKSKPRLTYSSRRRVAQFADCNKRLDFCLNDECLSDSSSISVQETSTQFGEVSNTVAADTSEMLCENLLNLSAYFTQTDSTSNNKPAPKLPAYEYPDEGEETNLRNRCSNVVRLSQEIDSLSKRNYQCQLNNDFNSSFEDFIGFPESDSVQGSKNEERLQDDQCKISDVTFLCNIRSQSPDKDYKNDHMVDRKVVADGQKDQLDDWNADYSDFFALVKTPPQICKTRLRKPHFTMASSKQTLITEEAKPNAVDILSNLSDLYPKQIFKSNILNERNTQTIDAQDICRGESKLINCTFNRSSLNDLDNLPSTSKAAIRTNKELNKRKAFYCESDDEHLDEKSTGTPSKQMRYAAKSNSDVTAGATVTNYSPNKPTKGFQTAGGKTINPTNKALKSVAELLKEFQSEPHQFDETGLEALKNKIFLKQNKQRASDTNNTKDKEPNLVVEDEFTNVTLSEWPLEEELKHVSQNIPPDIKSKTYHDNFALNPPSPKSHAATSSGFKGFCTARGNNVVISEKAQKTAASILKTMKNDCDTDDLLDIKNNILKKNRKSTANVALRECLLEEELKNASQNIPPDIKPKTDQHNFALNPASPKSHAARSSSFKGFCTARGNNVVISEKAQKTAASILKTLKTDCDTNDLLDIKNNILKKSGKNTATLSLRECPLEEEFRNVSQNIPPDIKAKTYDDNFALNPASPKSPAATSSGFKGFSTARGKNVVISEKAQKTAASILKTMKSDCDTDDLLDIKNNILKKNGKSTATDNQLNKRSNMTIALQDTSFVQEVEDAGDKSSNAHSAAFTTCQSNATSSLLRRSVSSPLGASVAKSTIARKNLLSLSKRRKERGRVSPAICDTVNANTLDTMQSSPISTSQVATLTSTPNEKSLKFNAANCSTPCSEQHVSCLREMDDDFKPIPWHANKSISGDCSNTTFSSPRPSVEDRLGRLKMYGDPPPISPILTNFQNRCRSSGLRPTRSMLKKHESK